MPSGKNAWLTFLTFDPLIKIVIFHALLAISMTNILLVELPITAETQPILYNLYRYVVCGAEILLYIPVYLWKFHMQHAACINCIVLMHALRLQLNLLQICG